MIPLSDIKRGCDSGCGLCTILTEGLKASASSLNWKDQAIHECLESLAFTDERDMDFVFSPVYDKYDSRSLDLSILKRTSFQTSAAVNTDTDPLSVDPGYVPAQLDLPWAARQTRFGWINAYVLIRVAIDLLTIAFQLV